MATVHETVLRIKALSPSREKLFYAAVIALVAILSFGIGRLSAFYGQGDGFGVQYTDTQ